MRAAIAMGAAGAVLAGVAAIGIAEPGSDLERRTAVVEGIPVTVTSPPGDAHAAVVLAHGFSGSAALMGSTATALASSGLAVVTFDFTGHGANPEPLPPSPAGGGAASSDALQRDLAIVLDWARAQPEVDPARVALAGHSMGAGAVVRFAVAAPPDAAAAPDAVVALSLPSAGEIPVGEPVRPPNLLLLAGALEPPAFRVAAIDGLRAAYPDAPLGTTMGDPAAGTARMADIVPGAEHIGIVFSATADASMVRWLAASLDVLLADPVEPRTPLWLVMSLVAAVLLVGAAGAVALGGRVIEPPRVVRGWAAILIALAAAVVASLVAALAAGIAGAAVPVALAGYVAVWFAVAGAVAIGILARRGTRVIPGIDGRDLVVAIGLAGLATVLIAVPGQRLWAAFSLSGQRWWVLALLVGCLSAWAWGDELLVRRLRTGRRIAVALGTRAIAVAVLLASVPLLGAPGFLVLLLPLMALLLVVLAVMAALVGRRPGGFLAAVLVQSVPLAVMVATTFPLIPG